jgi:Cof subfamily protein (haloacid dehalogenase superfamily)
MTHAPTLGSSTHFRLAAVDIDDTLLGPDTSISVANARAIMRLREAGILVMLASGRSHANMLPYHRALDFPTGPVLSAQGAVVRESSDGHVWHLHAMPMEQVRDVTERGRAREFSVLHYTLDDILIEAHTKWQQVDQARNASAHRLVPDLLSEALDDVTKIIWMGPPDVIAATVPIAQRELSERVAVIPTDPQYLEFAAFGLNKSVGLAATAQRLGIAREDVLAFGDGLNDVEMLAWAGRGVAMAHAKQAAKDAAAMVAPDGPHGESLARAIDLALSTR